MKNKDAASQLSSIILHSNVGILESIYYKVLGSVLPRKGGEHCPTPCNIKVGEHMFENKLSLGIESLMVQGSLAMGLGTRLGSDGAGVD